MYQIMKFLNENGLPYDVYTDDTRITVILDNYNSIKFDDSKNTLVDFLQFLLNTCNQILSVDRNIIKISKDDEYWMEDHPNFKHLKNQLEQF